MASNKYPTLTRAGLTQNYLHTNSTTHQFLFGAVAELLDNARDAEATKINVFSTRNSNVRGGFYLNFLDDGRGMEPSEVYNIVQFGKSFKRAAGDHMIGQYGNGLKSGSMRIGNDFILFTKRDKNMSALMLSRTFHDTEQIESIICPMPVWNSVTNQPIYQDGGKERHRQEIELMIKYSPFKTEAELMKQFKQIADETGTLIVIYNMKLLDSGEPELDIRTDRTDIRMAEMDPTDQGNLPERVSFKKYASILYLDPRMKIYVQSKKIRTKRLATTLCNPMLYKFSSNRFKKRSEDEVAKAEQEYHIAEERARECESSSRDMERKYSLLEKTSKESNTQLRKVQDKAVDARDMARMKKKELEVKKKSLKDRKTLDFVFGFNIENRSCYGMFIYNCSRLIRMYERVGPQLNGSDQCAGIIGVVNVPYLVLEPTHNKQHFADNKEYRHMLKAMGDHLQCYRHQAKEVNRKGGIEQFWQSFGYLPSSDWNDPPSQDAKYARSRAMKIPKVIQCDSCLKWRTLPFQVSTVGEEVCDDWVCSMNPDRQHGTCNASEEVQKIPEGSYKKEVKSAEQKKQELAQRIEKMERKLTKVSSPPHRSSSKSRRNHDDDESYEDDDEEGIFSKFQSKRTKAKSRRHRDDDGSPPPPSKKLRKHKKTKSFDDFICDDDMEEEDLAARRRRIKKKQKQQQIREAAAMDSDDQTLEQLLEDVETLSDDEVKQEKDASPRRSSKETNDIGKRAEIIVDQKWRSCRIVHVDKHNSTGKIKSYRFKFDQHPQDRFDQVWDEEKMKRESKSLRFIDHVSLNGKPSSSKNNDQRNGGSELTAAEIEKNKNVLTKLKTCLRYFLPPNWRISKDDITKLELDDIINFPMDEFFDHYEKGLRCLVANFKSQADQQKQAADQWKKQLHDSQQIIYDLLISHDKETPTMSFNDVVPYARKYLENLPKK